jgi:hypothetical protein
MPDFVEASDDNEAMEKARQRTDVFDLELWDLKRRVTVIRAKDK